MLDALIDSSDDSSDTDSSAILKQVDVSNNGIPGPKDSTSSLKEERDISKNKSQKYYQCHVILFFPLGDDPQKRIDTLGNMEEIYEVNVYHPMIYRWMNE